VDENSATTEKGCRSDLSSVFLVFHSGETLGSEAEAKQALHKHPL
jgi:hypothetical protein